MTWQDKLRKKFPKILGNIGFEHNKGWYYLIKILCKQLQWDIDMNGQPQIEATQVKEKFGSLRFYTGSATERQYAMITLAETLSGYICESCGSIEGVRQNTHGWIRSLCAKCRSERNNK